jgi:hypothetical protein
VNSSSDPPVRPWTNGVVNSSLSYREADPDDSDLDSFDAGDGEFAEEINRFFRGRGWVRIPEAICFQFGTHDEIVGYIVIGVRDLGHPTMDSAEIEQYLVIYVAGVAGSAQGLPDPGARTGHEDGKATFAVSMLQAVEADFARPARVAGLMLNVRAFNERAIGFYEKLHFEFDPEGDHIDRGKPTRVMRKYLP